MERDLLEREVNALSFGKTVLDLAPVWVMESEIKLKLEEGYFNYGILKEKSFLREKDQKTYQALAGMNLYFLPGSMVYIHEENAGWLLVEGAAFIKKSGLPINGKGWIKKSWVRIKQPVKLIASGDEREFKVEFETHNYIRRTDGRKKSWLPRKYGPGMFLVKGIKGKPATAGKEGTAVEMQSDTGGNIEFETPKWFRDWCELKERIEEAVAMINNIDRWQNKPGAYMETDEKWAGDKAVLVRFPFITPYLYNSPPRAKTKPVYRGLVAGKEYLEVAIADPLWEADIQVSEAIELTQYQSLLEEHFFDPDARKTVESVEVILTTANWGKIPPASMYNLRSFLQIIIYYILCGSINSLKQKNGSLNPAKFAFGILCRTSFSSIFRVLLSNEEKGLFRQIVQHEIILKALHLKGTLKFFVHGHHSDVTKPTLSAWLKSIVAPVAGKDLLSYSMESRKQGGFNGSAAMGKFDIIKPSDKIRFEIRGSQAYGKNSGEGKEKMIQPATEWVSFIEKIFKESNKRRNSGKGKQLKYDPAKC